jgi:hypothetical protein
MRALGDHFGEIRALELLPNDASEVLTIRDVFDLISGPRDIAKLDHNKFVALPRQRFRSP